MASNMQTSGIHQQRRPDHVLEIQRQLAAASLRSQDPPRPPVRPESTYSGARETSQDATLPARPPPRTQTSLHRSIALQQLNAGRVDSSSQTRADRKAALLHDEKPKSNVQTRELGRVFPPPLEHEQDHHTSLTRRAPHISRFSWMRASLTPSDVPLPQHLLASDDPEDRARLEAMIGLRPHGPPPPVPPKDFIHENSPTDGSSEDGSVVALSKGPPLEGFTEPLNGRVAWLHALTGMLVVFNCWGLSNAFGLFQAYYQRIYIPGNSPSAIAWIGSTQLALVFGLGVPVGHMVDRGWFRLMFHGGSSIMVLGVFCTALCEQLWSLWLVSGLITGLGMGMCFCSGIVALMTWFDGRRIGTAMALCATGSCFGGITYILLARHFLRVSGFKTTFLILGGLAAVTMLPANLVFRVRVQTPKLNSRDRIAANTPRRSHRSTLLAPTYLLTTVGLIFAFFGIYISTVYFPLYASTQLQVSDTAATNVLIVVLVANLPGRLLPALLSDACLGPLNTMIPSCIISAGVVGLWIAAGSGSEGHESLVSLMVIAAFYGFSSAGIQALYAPAVYSLCLEPTGSSAASLRKGNNSPRPASHLGLHSGIPFTCIGVACLVGLPIGGALISIRRDAGLDRPFLGAQAFAAACLLAAGLVLLAGRVARIGCAAGRA